MRNSNTLKVLLFTRDISSNPQKLTIYARITVNGKRAEISLKRYVSVNEWDENKGSSLPLGMEGTDGYRFPDRKSSGNCPNTVIGITMRKSWPTLNESIWKSERCSTGHRQKALYAMDELDYQDYPSYTEALDHYFSHQQNDLQVKRQLRNVEILFFFILQMSSILRKILDIYGGFIIFVPQ